MDTLLLTFLVKEKSVPVWAAQAHETKRLMKLSLEEEAERFYTLLRTKVSANLPFVELRAPHRGIFPFTRKDTKGVSKGTPLRYPWGK